MMKKIVSVVLVGLFISAGGMNGFANDTRPPAPSKQHVWVEAQVQGNVVIAPGFWRPQVKTGFVWQEGQWDAQGRYLAGAWHPVKNQQKNHVWVPGYWTAGKWHPGRWRIAKRAGFVWVPGHWNRRGEWQDGYWNPAKPAPRGKVWVPGYWNQKGVWIQGFWRLEKKRGEIWVPGYYNQNGVWVKGNWKKVKSGKMWVPGYRNAKGVWIAGHWRSKTQRNAVWVEGHYNQFGEWIPGHWAQQRKKHPQPRRKHGRVM